MFHPFHRSMFIWVCVTFLIQLCLCSHVFCAGRQSTGKNFLHAFAPHPAESNAGEEKELFLKRDFSAVMSGYSQVDDLFLHQHGWVGLELEEDEFNQNLPDSNAMFNHLKSAQPYNRMRLTLGRQQIRAGVTKDRVDGLKVSTGLGRGLSATAFGGLPSSTAASNGRQGDLIYGARIATHPRALYEIGLSYQKVKDNEENRHENAGADMTFRLGSWLTVNGLSSYSIDGQGWREHSYSAQLRYKKVQLRPFYRYFQTEDQFDKHSMENRLFGFLGANEEIVNIAGTDVLWQAARPLQIGVRARQYDYDLRDEKALYYAGLFNLRSTGGSRLNIEIGRMQGETQQNSYSLLRCNLHWRNPLGLSHSFLGADMLYLDYDQPVLGQDVALHAGMNAGFRFLDDKLEARLSGIFSQDPYFGDDVGALFTLSLDY